MYLSVLGCVLISSYLSLWDFRFSSLNSSGTFESEEFLLFKLNDDLSLEDLSLEIPILYGGSVNPSNSRDILESDYVDGVLVGGASTKIDHFEGILNSI